MRDLCRRHRGRCAPAALGLLLFQAFACRRAPPPPPPPPPAAAVVNGAAIPLSRGQLALDRARRGKNEETKVPPQDLPNQSGAVTEGPISCSPVLHTPKP